MPDEVKHERLERLVDVVQRFASERNAERVGTTVEVLVEGWSRTDASLLRGQTRGNTMVNFTGNAARASSPTSCRRRHLDHASRCTAHSGRGMKILVTGSSGRSARTSRTGWKHDGHDVFGVDKRQNTWTDDFRYLLQDLAGHYASSRGINGVEYPEAARRHLAAHAKVHQLVRQPQRALENAVMTFNVLEYARQQRIPIVFSSSREVYGDVHRFEEYRESIADFVFTESAYSASKIAGEAFIYSYARCYGLPYLVFRFSNVYGRYDNDLHRMVRVMPLFIHAMLRGEPITVYGGREKTLDFTYVDDCVDGIVRGIEALAEGRVVNQTINLAYGQGNTLVHVAERIASELGVEPDMTIAPSLLGEVTHYVADLARPASCSATTRRCRSTRASPAPSPGSVSTAKPIRGERPGHGNTRAAARTMSSTAGRQSPFPQRRCDLRPDRVGQVRVAEAMPSDAGRARLRRLDAGLPRAPDPHEPGRPCASGRHLAARPPGHRRRVPGAGARGDRRDRRRRPNCRRRRRLRSLVSGSPDRRRLPADVPADARARWGGSTTGAARRPRTACCRRAIPVPRHRCTRTTASASCGRSSSGRRAERWSRSNRACGAPSCACRPSSRASTSRARPWRTDPRANGGDVRAGRGARGAGRRRGRSPGARPRCRTRATPDEAMAELERGTMHFAAYQRKWMRRIPGIVMIDADRPAGEVADAILEVARTR